MASLRPPDFGRLISTERETYERSAPFKPTRFIAPLGFLMVVLASAACEPQSTTSPNGNPQAERPHPSQDPAFVFLLSCPSYQGWVFYGCRAMTGSELTGLWDVYTHVYPGMIYPTGWETCGDFRDGGEDFLGMTLFVFDSLKVDGQHRIGFVDTLEDVGGVRLSDLGTTEAGRTVFHEGGHISRPEMLESVVEWWTQECFAEFGQDY